jgi:hypothetical protein
VLADTRVIDSTMAAPDPAERTGGVVFAGPLLNQHGTRMDRHATIRERHVSPQPAQGQPR